MSDNKKASETPMSLSKQRKLQRQKDIQREQRNRKIATVVAYVAAVLGAALACFLVFLLVRRLVTRVTSNSDYSKYLTTSGLVEGVTATDYVTLGQYKGVEIAYKDIAYSDDELKKAIDALLKEKADQSKTTDKAVEKGDVIVVEYKSYFEDGTEVKDGATGEKGSTITVGSSTLKDYGFDTALIGKKISPDPFVVEVKFPSTYSKDPAVAGKTIKYSVAIQSIKVTPEYTDDFVKENFKDIASTTEEYSKYLRDTAEREALEEAVAKYVIEHSEISKYPSKYLSQVKSLIKYNQESTYAYYNYLYQQIYGAQVYASFEEYIGMSEAKFDRELIKAGKSQVKTNLTYQAIAEVEGIKADLAGYKEEFLKQEGNTEESYETQVKNYGEGALVQQHLVDKVIDFIADKAVVTGK